MCDGADQRLRSERRPAPSNGNELGLRTGSFRKRQSLRTGYKWPWRASTRSEIQRQLPLNMGDHAGYTRREKLGNFVSRNVAVPMETYIPLNATEASNGRSVTSTPVARSGDGRFGLDQRERARQARTNGTDITLDKRLSNG